MKAAWIILGALLVGCDDPSRPENRGAAVDLVESTDGNRFEVRFVQRIADSTAYNGKRGVYIIVDRETGAEYVGVSGIGISELGSHSTGAGKTRRTVADER